MEPMLNGKPRLTLTNEDGDRADLSTAEIAAEPDPAPDNRTDPPWQFVLAVALGCLIAGLLLGADLAVVYFRPMH
jgi:hypothetical protein